MRIVVANLSRGNPPVPDDPRQWWGRQTMPEPQGSVPLEAYRDWGYHLLAAPVWFRGRHPECRIELWEDRLERGFHRNPLDVLKLAFLGASDALGYLEARGAPDLFVNYGSGGIPLLEALEGRCFRVHVPCQPMPGPRPPAEGYLVDRARDLDERSRLYVPPINDDYFRPLGRPPERDFVYLASLQPGKRHRDLVKALRGSELTGHFHPVPDGALDLSGTRITRSDWSDRDLNELINSARIAVYAGEETSNPAAMWECVAAGRPILVNWRIAGGVHVVVPGVTGEIARLDGFAGAIRKMLARLDAYRPREHQQVHWDSRRLAESYLHWFGELGWQP